MSETPDRGRLRHLALIGQPRIADGAIVYPIACETAITAAVDGRDLPDCRWILDGEMATCAICSKKVRPGEPRAEPILPMLTKGG